VTAVEALILAKSAALIEKTKGRVAQIDSSNFPTGSSESARKLLIRTLDLLGKTATSPAVAPEALYNALIRFQELVQDVESSTSEHIAWPLVSYCDDLWLSLFPAKEAQIVYTVTSEHNYSITSFSSRLKILLKPILTTVEIDGLVTGNTIYCLQLASLEEENLPLYANIGHEFGHALWWAKETELLGLLVDDVAPVYAGIRTELKGLDLAHAGRRALRVVSIITSVAKELFCDQIGSLVSGPAFVLSLHEMSWGSNESRWTGRLVPLDAHITAYPSFRFRMHCLKRLDSIIQYEAEADKAFKRLSDEQLKGVASYMKQLSTDHSTDSLIILPESDPDRDAIQSVLLHNLSALKSAMEKFLDRCGTDFLPPFKAKPEFAPVSVDKIAALLQRLRNDILPNIAPDGTLLGQRASFSEILNASALYRIVVLQRPAANAEEMFSELDKVERLTDKAMEVSYIQRDFQNWQRDSK
jgi:hypothetical protein